MLRRNPILLAAAIAVALAGHGQNMPPTATPQTGSAATGSASTGAQAAEAGATRSSGAVGSPGAAQAPGKGGSRRGGSAGGGASLQGGNTAGATRRAGSRGRRGLAAPVANADVVVTGRNDGSANSHNAESATLPGMPMLPNAFGIPRGTPILVRLLQPVDSGHAKNGDTLRAVLAAPAGTAPAGTPVELTVVAAAAAGQISSNGELSVQVISIGGQMVLSDVITAEGKEGAKLLPDDAPARGTEAVFTPDQPITLPAG